ncbi:MAG: Fur family transcriptional regulator, ferric uptake regulator [Actinomycetota bacterium]|jgi:Fe2+ or Zn2+ uptake regulation protein|nr:Fur family transcriptional regulator, ferric uptake regulator [Actinomycetota bacterium]
MVGSPSDDWRGAATAHLARVGQRLTQKRASIVELLATSERPLTMPEIREQRPDLAQSSLYRNLVVLEQAGVVRRVVTHDEFARYELGEALTGHHHHLVCSRCGLVEDVPASPGLERSVAAAMAGAAEATGFRIDHHRLDLIGVCRRCA